MKIRHLFIIASILCAGLTARATSVWINGQEQVSGSSGGSSALTNGQVQASNVAANAINRQNVSSDIATYTNRLWFVSPDIPGHTNVWYQIGSCGGMLAAAYDFYATYVVGSGNTPATIHIRAGAKHSVTSPGREPVILYAESAAGTTNNGFDGAAIDSGGNVFVSITNGTDFSMSSVVLYLEGSGLGTIGEAQPSTFSPTVSTPAGNSSFSYCSPGLPQLSFARGSFSSSLTLGGSNVMTSAGGGGGGAFAFTGTNNIAPTNGLNSFISTSIRSFLGGGYTNQIEGTDGAIVAGASNSTVNSGARSIIGAGRNNTINTASDATIGGGVNNDIGSSGTASFIGGGSDNLANSSTAGIGAGSGNTNNAADGWIGGGYQNRIASGSGDSVVGGGYANTIADGANLSDATTIGGGSENHAADAGQTISGGYAHDLGAAAYYSTVGGGYDNNIGASATYNFIGGGLNNDMSASTLKCVIGGGEDNNFLNGPVRCVIGGGENNQVNGAISYETIGGGFRNQIQSGGGVASDYSTIGGGYTNRVSGMKSGYAVIGGGYHNSITNDDTDAQGTTACFIGGGGDNVIGSGYDSAILGGDTGRIDGRYSFILGGYQCQTRGTNTFASGYRAKATNVGSFAWSDSSSTNEFNTTRDNSFVVRASGGIQWSPGGDGRTNVFLIPPRAFITNSTPSTIVAPCDGAEVLDKGSNNLWIAYQSGVATNWHLVGNLTVVAP